MDTGGGSPPAPADSIRELEELEKELLTDVRRKEIALHKMETAYLMDCLAPSDTLPFVGNLASGWEILLEGKNPDKKKCVEKIYSGAGAPRARARAAAAAQPATARPHPRPPQRPLLLRRAVPAESSRTWLNYREAQERRKAQQNAELAERAAAAAFKVAEQQGKGGEAARAAAAAAGAAAVAAAGGGGGLRVKKRKEAGDAEAQEE